jgi:uncharacterized protein with PIN domain
MKFIADAMLGKLAKWLRIYGCDVLYYPDMEDRQIIQIARAEERTVLTRDTRMLQCKGVGAAVFIRSEDISEQLLQMKGILDIRDPDLAERCALCNGRLHAVADKEELRELVPDYVYHHFCSFMRCGGCSKVYWEGSHYQNIRERLREILRQDSED